MRMKSVTSGTSTCYFVIICKAEETTKAASGRMAQTEVLNPPGTEPLPNSEC